MANSNPATSALRTLRERPLPEQLSAAKPQTPVTLSREESILNDLSTFLAIPTPNLREMAEKSLFVSKLSVQVAQALEEGLPCVKMDYDGRWGPLLTLGGKDGIEIGQMTLHEQWSQPPVYSRATLQQAQAAAAQPSESPFVALPVAQPVRRGSLPEHLAALPERIGARINKLYSLPKNDLYKLNLAATGLVDVIVNKKLTNTFDEMTPNERAEALKALEITVRELAANQAGGESPVAACLTRIAAALRDTKLEIAGRQAPAAIHRIEGFFKALSQLETCATDHLPAALDNCGKTALVIAKSRHSQGEKVELFRRLARTMNVMANHPDAQGQELAERRRLVGCAFRDFVVPKVPKPVNGQPRSLASRLHEDMERQLQVARLYDEAHPHSKTELKTEPL